MATHLRVSTMPPLSVLQRTGGCRRSSTAPTCSCSSSRVLTTFRGEEGALMRDTHAVMAQIALLGAGRVQERKGEQQGKCNRAGMRSLPGCYGRRAPAGCGWG